MVKKQSFENAMKQLEKIVSELESGDAPLEQTLKKFEDGMALVKYCQKKLDETERKIDLLVKNGDGPPASLPFQNNEDGSNE